MVFLHNETTGTVQVLTQAGEKSSYISGDPITGHLKPLALEDSTFDQSGISGAAFKFTVKVKAGSSELIKQGDKFLVGSQEYICKDSKPYNGITFGTSKFLLVIE